MKYEVKINDWSSNLEVTIECDDFDLASEIQMAIESIVDQFNEILDEEEENEQDDQEDDSIVIDDSDDTHTTITITRN